MRQCILHPPPPLQHIRTKLDPVFRVKPALHALVGLTPPTPDIALIQLAPQLGDVGGQVADDGRVLEEVVALGLAAPAVERLVAEVRVEPVGLLACG